MTSTNYFTNLMYTCNDRVRHLKFYTTRKHQCKCVKPFFIFPWDNDIFQLKNKVHVNVINILCTSQNLTKKPSTNLIRVLGLETLCSSHQYKIISKFKYRFSAILRFVLTRKLPLKYLTFGWDNVNKRSKKCHL